MDRAGRGSSAILPPEEDVGETLHWSDEEDELESNDGIKPLLPRLREEIAEYNAILRALDFQETTDITASLASRAHLERLIDQYWDLCVKLGIDERATEQEGEENEEYNNDAAAMKQVGKKLQDMILHHPSFRSSPLLHRWPLLAADVPKPTWTLGDEMLAVMQKHQRSSKNNGDMLEIDPEAALPATITCQHALLAILQDLSVSPCTESTYKDKVDQRRDVLVGWRDVLASIKKRNDIPLSVKEATEKRLEEIYGQVEYATPPFWMSAIGMGGQDRASRFLKAENVVAPPQYQQAIRSKEKLQSSKALIRDLDHELLSCNTNKKGRYLQAPPRIRSPKPTLSRTEVRERRRKKKERRERQRSKSQQDTVDV